MTRRLLVGPGGQPNHRRWLQILHDGASTLGSLDALVHSLDTLRLQGRTGVADLTADGFNPMRDYEELARREGYFALFRQRDMETIRAYRRRPKNLYTLGSRSSPPFEDVSAILDAARARRIPVWVVIYPYHAHLLEILRITGCWDLFEEWKRELVRRIEHGDPQGAVLWDFSGYHRYALEAVPAAHDRSTPVHWYWEAGHFKKELGHLILEQMLGGKGKGFGVMLTRENVEAHLTAMRLDGQRYRLERVREIEQLERLAR